MIVPSEYRASAAELDSPPPEKTFTPVSAVPFDVIELAEAGASIFTVPVGEYYRIIKISFYAQAAGTVSARAVPSGATLGSEHILFADAVANFEEGSIPTLEGQFFGPGETLYLSTTGSGSIVNFKVSVERISAGYELPG